MYSNNWFRLLPFTLLATMVFAFSNLAQQPERDAEPAPEQEAPPAQHSVPQQPQAPSVPSPNEITDQELVTFIAASDAIQPIQEAAQSSMISVIEEEGMEIGRFQEIMLAMQNPQLAATLEISPEEEQALHQMRPRLMEIETRASGEMQDEINEKGLEVERYQEIYRSLLQYPELMERLEVLLEDD